MAAVVGVEVESATMRLIFAPPEGRQAARRIDFIGDQLDAVNELMPNLGVRARQRQDDADIDGLATAKAGPPMHRRGNGCARKLQGRSRRRDARNVRLGHVVRLPTAVSRTGTANGFRRAALICRLAHFRALESRASP